MLVLLHAGSLSTWPCMGPGGCYYAAQHCSRHVAWGSQWPRCAPDCCASACAPEHRRAAYSSGAGCNNFLAAAVLLVLVCLLCRYNHSGVTALRFEADYSGLMHFTTAECVVDVEVVEDKVIEVPDNSTAANSTDADADKAGDSKAEGAADAKSEKEEEAKEGEAKAEKEGDKAAPEKGACAAALTCSLQRSGWPVILQRKGLIGTAP